MRPVRSAICTSAEAVSVSWRRCSVMVAVLSAMTSLVAPNGPRLQMWSSNITGSVAGPANAEQAGAPEGPGHGAAVARRRRLAGAVGRSPEGPRRLGAKAMSPRVAAGPAVGRAVATDVGRVEVERRREAVHQRARSVQHPLDLLDRVVDADRRPLDGEGESDDVAEGFVEQLGHDRRHGL